MQILSNPCALKIGSFCRCQMRFSDNLPIEVRSPHGDTQLDDNSVHDDWRLLNSRHHDAQRYGVAGASTLAGEVIPRYSQREMKRGFRRAGDFNPLIGRQ